MKIGLPVSFILVWGNNRSGFTGLNAIGAINWDMTLTPLGGYLDVWVKLFGVWTIWSKRLVEWYGPTWTIPLIHTGRNFGNGAFLAKSAEQCETDESATNEFTRASIGIDEAL